MRKNEPKPKINFIKRRNFFIKGIIAAITIAVILFSIKAYFLKALTTSDYFRITDIRLIGIDSIDLSYLKSKNIFTLDLAEESHYILQAYPGFSKVRLVKVLPNRIAVYFIRRKPIAILKLYRDFAIDEEAVLFLPSEAEKDLGLPQIVGLETKIFGPKPGIRYNIKEINLALSIIKEMNKSRALRDYKIKRINVASAVNTSFFLSLSQNLPRATAVSDALLEIKVGQKDVMNKIEILSNLIPQVRNSLGKLKYIDLRFKDPVIKLNNAKP